jgi:very-short-patch-repair endonuclease
MLQGVEGGTARARRLRQELSLPEVLLWVALKPRPAGLKFRKQHPAGPFTADFYCHDARLIIAVDGEAHNRGDCPRRDTARDHWFALRELAMLGIPAAEVLRDGDAVGSAIVEVASSRLRDQE